MNILRKELTDIANEWNRHLLSPNKNNTPSVRPDVMYFLLYLYGTTNHMISINTAETSEFIDISSSVPAEFSHEFAETLINEDNMAHGASYTFDLHLYLFSKIVECSLTTLDAFNFASIKFYDFFNFLPNSEIKYSRKYKQFVLAKFDTRKIKSNFNEKQ